MRLSETSRLNTPIQLSVVVPLFNEEENLQELHRRLTAALAMLEEDYELVLVNDGSRDATPHLLNDLAEADAHVVAVHLSRNFGHQAAVCAGLDEARGAAVIVMDGDLQDPPEALGQFLEKWRSGNDVVYAVRTKRKENWLKRAGYFLFYRMLRAVSDLEIPLDSGDFCLMDRRVVDALKALPERQRFVRGLRSFVGFRQIGVRYERAAREAGQPKYTLTALMRLAMDGLIGFSSAPLNAICYMGALSLVATLALLGCWLTNSVAGTEPPAGLNGISLALLFIGSVQLLSLGIIGQYLRRIFQEVKGRPTYITQEVRRAERRAIVIARKKERAI
ncbi:MAG: glycosyltransferase family 2 protein [Planctomycetes bacterium]|nr:glycosyltransferase family 2 protein [Planctomycetota bacterium]